MNECTGNNARVEQCMHAWMQGGWMNEWINECTSKWRRPWADSSPWDLRRSWGPEGLGSGSRAEVGPKHEHSSRVVHRHMPSAVAMPRPPADGLIRFTTLPEKHPTPWLHLRNLRPTIQRWYRRKLVGTKQEECQFTRSTSLYLHMGHRILIGSRRLTFPSSFMRNCWIFYPQFLNFEFLKSFTFFPIGQLETTSIIVGLLWNWPGP